MSTISFDTFNDGDVLTAANLNSQFTKISTLINTDKLSNTDLQNSSVIISYPFYIDSASSTVLKPKVRFPGTGTFTYVDLAFVVDTMGAATTFEVDLLDNSGSSVLDSVLSLSAAGSTNIASGFDGVSATGGQVNTITLTRSSGTNSADSVTIILTVKAELTS